MNYSFKSPCPPQLCGGHANLREAAIIRDIAARYTLGALYAIYCVILRKVRKTIKNSADVNKNLKNG